MIAYRDGAAALDWLSKAFGFEERERWLDEGVLTPRRDARWARTHHARDTNP
jgi:uncharacterized glyoxalase superfamily protein PhnB